MSVSLPGPRLLAASVKRAVELHPFTASGGVELTERVRLSADGLWKRLTSLSADSLRRAITALDGAEVTLLFATAGSRLTQDGVLAILCALFEQRPPRAAARLAWDAYLATDGDPRLRPHALPHIRENPRCTAWRGILEVTPASGAAAALYVAQPLSLTDWAASPPVSLDGHPEFLRALRRHLLSKTMLRATARRESTPTINEWVATSIAAHEREAWYGSYLDATYREGWSLDHAVVGTILEQYGEPSAGRSFWKLVTPEAAEAFELWFKNRQLTSLLGEGERVLFWRRFLPQMTGSSFNADQTVVFVRFPGWFAAQFKFSGTATYLIRERFYLTLRRQSEASIRAVVLDLRHRGPDAIVGRYTHQGGMWEMNAAAEVRRVLRDFGSVT